MALQIPERVERLVLAGDEHAKLVYDAMALNIAKNIAKLSVDVNGKIDYIVLTGGIAYSSYITKAVKERVEFIAPVEVIPGEKEMDSPGKRSITCSYWLRNSQNFSRRGVFQCLITRDGCTWA